MVVIAKPSYGGARRSWTDDGLGRIEQRLTEIAVAILVSAEALLGRAAREPSACLEAQGLAGRGEAAARGRGREGTDRGGGQEGQGARRRSP